ncbi:nuclear export factor CRM1 [Salpingoeca rosetta]|uniref:Exportin-1 n=1 Tax=Salpingoeca rosetta (strain ATCC 50818 / BSB-021) TaxID=946362 RepID=F2U8J1_SALR5|nr:nuclear export factor CRM1 [Salpingoeca rosetta]EGD72699.1 nuclear export factor CRM1 [Salpingoeca rosetta]|eukprot:XP_004994522.1 nuclear export factor CRM1 [Salpingoeca rosetta]
MSLTEEQAAQLLDFEQASIDVSVLDTIVRFFYESRPGCPEQKMAEQIMKQFQEHPDAWMRASQILQESQYPSTKYFALNILKDVIRTKWKLLPEEQTEGIRNFIVSMTIEASKDFESLQENRVLLSKLNAVLVQILKQQWPQQWPSFITDIVGASRTSEPLCQNNLEILKLLSEEIFDYSKGQIVQVKAQHLKDALCQEFGPIYELCEFVLENAGEPTLINQALQTMLRFLSWIPIGYVFETNLINLLVTRFLNVPIFRNSTLECLAEIAALPGDAVADIPMDDLQSIQAKQLQLLQGALKQLVEMLPPSTDVAGMWHTASMEEQGFIRMLALFLTSWLKQHGQLLEADPSLRETHDICMNYALMISTVADKELFKIMLEYWSTLAGSLYSEATACGTGMFTPNHEPKYRYDLYHDLLSTVRSVIISQMPKPEEVLIVEVDGEPVREFAKDTDTIELYKAVRITLVYLTHLDPYDTNRIMRDMLARIVDGSQYSWHNLNTLCWAIGSISGTMSVDDEKKFLVQVIRELLGLCEARRGKNHKAVIAANIMYVVGQYPRFLRMHWKFLKTVVNKLFEFMHEEHDGVQDMACDTFIKIATKCKQMFVMQQLGETKPFVIEIIDNMGRTTQDLTQQQIQTFFKAVGHMISAQTDPEQQTALVQHLMALPNSMWSRTMQAVQEQPDQLMDQATLKQLVHFFRCNYAVASTVSAAFMVQLQHIFNDSMLLYRTMSQHISSAIAQSGESVTKQPLVRTMRAVRRDILRVLEVLYQRADTSQEELEALTPTLLEHVLSDYSETVPQSRESTVLSVVAECVSRLGQSLLPAMGDIFQHLFEPTVDMIKEDFETFPEFRRPFFAWLGAVVNCTTDVFSDLSPEQFKTVLDAIIWGCRHPQRDVAECSLKVLRNLMTAAGSATFKQLFFQNFFLEVLQQILLIATDPQYAANMVQHTALLSQMFFLVENGTIDVPLQEGQTSANVDVVRSFVGSLLKENFPHFADEQVSVIVDGFFAYDQSPGEFKNHLRDLIVQAKEMASGDLGDLFLTERADQLKEAQERKMKRLAAIPGMLNPHSDVSKDKNGIMSPGFSS